MWLPSRHCMMTGDKLNYMKITIKMATRKLYVCMGGVMAPKKENFALMFDCVIIFVYIIEKYIMYVFYLLYKEL